MSKSLPAGYFDELRSTLHVNAAALSAITGSASAEEAREVAAKLTESDGLTEEQPPHPTMLGIVDVLTQPARSIIVERFVNGAVALLFVAADKSGRYIITDPRPERGETLVMATTLSLIPGLLRQSMRLHGNHKKSTRDPITTTVQHLDEMLNSQLTSGIVPKTDDQLSSIASQLQHAWRASGSWAEAQTDSSMTILAARDEGLWSVQHDEQRIGGSPLPDTEVILTPRSTNEVIVRLGDVVTGRNRTIPRQSL